MTSPDLTKEDFNADYQDHEVTQMNVARLAIQQYNHQVNLVKARILKMKK